MFEQTFQPRFVDTDALGHINNTVLPVWFEGAREPIFRIFTPTMDVKTWPLILARIDVDFIQQIYFETEVTLRTYISKVGNSSLTIAHEAWQNSTLAAKGSAVMVHFDQETQKSSAIPDAIREVLHTHLREKE